MSEDETLDAVLTGKSLARYGDGEFKMAMGAGIKSQVADALLSKRLRDILQDSGECLVGIPNINAPTPKREFWNKFRPCANLLTEKRRYASAFVTRPDSAPWINTEAYWGKVQQLWLGREVTLVRGSSKSLTGEVLAESGAGHVTEIVARRQHAWIEYGSLLERIGTPSIVLLCLGPTATVMAVDLCARGVHAVDLGHLGMFWKKHQRGDPMWVSEADKVAP
jgi:hypothetical protein